VRLNDERADRVPRARDTTAGRCCVAHRRLLRRRPLVIDLQAKLLLMEQRSPLEVERAAGTLPTAPL
jgi:hypothetical protein